MSNERIDGETYSEWSERVNRPTYLRNRERMERDDWTPWYEPWRHGGSYVVNIQFPEGGCGCIASSRHTLSGKFESACFDLGTFKTRDAAARAEREHAMKLWREWDAAQAEKEGAR